MMVRVSRQTYVRSVGSPSRHRPTSSLPRTIIRRTSTWCCWSTHPPLRISESKALDASSAISSGVTPGCDTASAECNAPVVDSANRLSAYPGDLSYWSKNSSLRTEMSIESSLSAVFALVDVRVKIYVGYISIEDRTSCLNHSVGKLWAHSHSMTENTVR